jgi:hypothetical protein
MIKDVMVRLDGTEGDGVRLAAVDQIAAMFESHVTGLFFNILPPPVSGLLDGFGAGPAAQLLDKARQTGDVIEAAVLQCLTRLQHPTNLHGSTWPTRAILPIPQRFWRGPSTLS